MAAALHAPFKPLSPPGGVHRVGVDADERAPQARQEAGLVALQLPHHQHALGAAREQVDAVGRERERAHGVRVPVHCSERRRRGGCGLAGVRALAPRAWHMLIKVAPDEDAARRVARGEDGVGSVDGDALCRQA